MKPTKENAGEFWWLLDKGCDNPDVVLISLKYGSRDKIVCWFTGWEMPVEVDKLTEGCVWLGRAVPPEVKSHE